MLKKIILTCFILFIICFIGYKIWETVDRKEKVNESIKNLPSFGFTTLNYEIFNSDSLLSNKNNFLLFFNTTCEHCQYETEQILKNKAAFTNTNILFISKQPINELKVFDSIYQIYENSSMKLLQDSLDITFKIFGINSNPSSIIYDSNKKLLNAFKGEVKIETIISLLHKNE